MWRYSPVTTGPKNSRQVRRSSRIVAPVRFWISCRRAALSEQANIAFEERENEADVENGDVRREDACCWHPRQVSQSNAARRSREAGTTATCFGESSPTAYP